MTMLFLSHSSADKPMVRKLARDVESLGVDVWLDEREIRVGDSIPQAIQEGIEKSDLLALWVTPASLASRWVMEEWQTKFFQQTNERKALVYPLLAGPVVLPPFLKQRRYADFRRSYMFGLGELAQALDKVPEFEESIALQIQGDWEGDTHHVGRAHFVVQGTRVSGSYLWRPLGTIGKLTGEIVAGRIVCQWFNGGSGCAIFDLIGDRLVGSWWGDGVGPPYFALLNGAEPTAEFGENKWSMRKLPRQ